MDDTDDNPTGDHDWIQNLPLRSEEIGFAPGEMLACRKCGKANAPNRAACLYCGAEIEGTIAGKKLDIRPLEIWENGFNLVVVDARNADFESAATQIASLLGVDAGTLQPIITAPRPLPIARVETEEHAAFLAGKLVDLGIRTRTMSDASLMPTIAPVRLRGISFEDDVLVLTPFNPGDLIRVNRDSLALIVPGVLFEARTETLEKRKRKSTTTISETQTSSDLRVIDIYSRDEPAGWRISSYGFDFSCIGPDKSMLVAENMESLVVRLMDACPSAKLSAYFVDDHSLLEHCWPSEARKDAYGFQRSGFARKDLSSVSSTNNAVQLLKYSRLQWHLL